MAGPMRRPRLNLSLEADVQLQFIGVDPDSDIDESPTAWVDLESADIVIQSYTADDAT